MYTFIRFKRNRGRDRDEGVKKEEERDQRWREKLQLFTFAYLTHPPNKVFVPTVMYSSFLTFQKLIRLSFSVNIQDFDLIFPL